MSDLKNDIEALGSLRSRVQMLQVVHYACESILTYSVRRSHACVIMTQTRHDWTIYDSGNVWSRVVGTH